MRTKKKISLLLFGVILFASISSAFGYHEYIYRWEDDGAVSVGCHGSATASENGTMVLTLNFTGTLEPLEIFNVTITLTGFTEALLDPYDDRFTLGITGQMGDNGEFSSPKDEKPFKRREKVDENGTYDEDDGGNTFVLYAPATPGTYTLGAVAIAGMNQTDERQYAQVYIEGSIEITVVSTIDVVDPIVSADTDDFSVENDYTGEIINWTATDANANTYTITHNGIVVVTATAWTSGTEIQYAVPDDLAEVNHVYTIEFTDNTGNVVRDTVVMTVEAAVAPATIPGFQALYIIVPIAIVAMAVLLKRKVKI